MDSPGMIVFTTGYDDSIEAKDSIPTARRPRYISVTRCTSF
jgi:hypothetical protein